MWSVRVLSGPSAGQICDLKFGKNIFGRGTTCDFKVQSVGISKEHCEIHVYKDKMIIVDLKSSNGTFINGVKIQNSILRLGDKISLFDIIMDVIPTPDIRPKNTIKRPQNIAMPGVNIRSSSSALVPQDHHQPPVPQAINYSADGSAAFQMQGENYPPPEAPVPAAAHHKTIQQNIDDFIEDKLMPAIYRLALLFPFKHVLLGFVLIFVFGVTVLSVFPLTVILKESSLIESIKRAKSVARTMAKVNEQALLSNQLGSLTVQDAMKEDGIKEAFIIQQSDGHIVAPSEKVGRDFAKPFILKAIKESRATADRIDNDMIGASFPIGVYDPVSGEPTVKYHAVVFYDVSSLNVDEGRMVSLFMQTLIISSVLGLILYFLFSRLMEYPFKSLNQQIDQALRDKTDRTEVLFDYPALQQLTTNVNTLLNRVWNSADSGSSKPQQNRDLEYTNLVDMVTQPAIVIAADHRIVAVNYSFEQICQMQKENLLNQSYQIITDSSLLQNMDSLIVRCQQSPYEKHVDRIPFSQFECDIQCQVYLDAVGSPEYYLMTLNQANQHL